MAGKTKIVYASEADKVAARRVRAPLVSANARAEIVSQDRGHVSVELKTRVRTVRPVRREVEELKLCLRAAMRIIRKLADSLPDLNRVKGKTAAEILERLANGATGGNGTSDHVVDAVEIVIGWVNSYGGDKFARRVVLEWARRTPWEEIMAIDPNSRGRWQLNQVLNRTLETILDGMERDGKLKELAQATQILV
ncbi:hypothetical protein [Magnetospirillum fulvum]|uniref:Uncharacterized protein n=1 Tax=Magnetospirillum fulvum MGU-K5 TaxID=1316936 RepID=S9TQV3_MAGFU|nr:hypothetical protein [Magnetospirillum fulvum]EPY00935.1 hypothetical protein K678_13663 [Magnetospirillum fulvum MGU-K5]